MKRFEINFDVKANFEEKHITNEITPDNEPFPTYITALG